AHAKKARELRRQLEAFHGRQDSQAVEAAWPHLSHADPWIAHAARVALEHQPPVTWQARALNEVSDATALPALMALARVGNDSALLAIFKRLQPIPLASLSVEQQLVALRTYEICLQRVGADAPLIARLIEHLQPLLPATSAALNQELAKMLVALGAPGIVAETLSLLGSATTQEEKLHYLFLLRNVRDGWTDDNRARYFRALSQMDSFRGGAGLPKFVQQIRSEALAAIPDDQRPRFAALLENRAAVEQDSAAAARPFVRRWTLADLESALPQASHGRNFTRGRQLYAATMCIRCHQLGDLGRPFGPDLTDVARRFNRKDLLASILLPSQVVSETYRNVTVTLKDGRTVTGRIALEGDYRLQVLRVATDALAPDKFTEVPKNEIVSYTESLVSPMPEGLLDTLTRDEILDLLAFIEAGGSPNHQNFR
ncbi:MAG: c-type cytochrome, partial [Verrucomicrobiota bacterium]